MAGDGYLRAEWIAAHKDRYTPKQSRTIDEIILHSTDGGTADARVTARNLFAQPKEYDPKTGQYHQQSAHYIVGRDGTVVQCVLHKDIAWHANEASLYTIGIEHNARNSDSRLTWVQYYASAELVVWLCQKFGLPTNRYFIMGHSEADKTTSHSQCPQRVLDWKIYMEAVDDVLNAQAGRQKLYEMRWIDPGTT